MPDDGACMNLVAAQIVDVDEKMNMAVEESVRLLGVSNWTTMTSSVFIFGSTVSTPTISRLLCKNICGCFGLSAQIDVAELEQLLSDILWRNMKKFLRTNLSQVLLLWASAASLTVFTMFGGIPVLASIPIATVAPAARMIVKCACDLIMILAAVFDQKGPSVQLSDFEKGMAQYTTKAEGGGPSIRKDVHREIDALIPIHNLKIFEGLKIALIRREMQRIIRRYRFVLGEGRGCTGEQEVLNAAAEASAQNGNNNSNDEMYQLELWKDRQDGKSPQSPASAELPAYSANEQLHHKASEADGREVQLGFKSLNDPLMPAELSSGNNHNSDRIVGRELAVELPLNTVPGSPENPAQLP